LPGREKALLPTEGLKVELSSTSLAGWILRLTRLDHGNGQGSEDGKHDHHQDPDGLGQTCHLPLAQPDQCRNGEEGVSERGVVLETLLALRSLHHQPAGRAFVNTARKIGAARRALFVAGKPAEGLFRVWNELQ